MIVLHEDYEYWMRGVRSNRQYEEKFIPSVYVTGLLEEWPN